MADDPLEAVLSHFRIARRRGDRAEVYCPGHDDRQASLSVSRGIEQPVVLHCHAGCPPEKVTAAVGLTMSALMGGEPHIVETYAYTDENGRPLYYVDRWVPKAFRPRLLDGTYARPSPAAEVLYHLPEVLAAVKAGRPVFVVEGERDVETARGFGMTATTAMSGAGQPWLPQFTDALRGGRIIVVADNDQPGRARARRLVAELEPYVASVRAVVPRVGKDLSDHLWAGYTWALLDPLPSEGLLLRYQLAHVAAAPIEWAWEGWVPGGMLSIIEGDPGEGKSVLTVDLAARWTTGARMPDGAAGYGVPVNVGLCSAEDDPARVIKPRLVAAGGDTKRLIYIAGMPLVGGRYNRSIDLAADIEALREAIEAERLRVLILDPLMAFLGSTKTAIDAEVRKVLTPLRYLAEETDCAIITVRHLRKAGGKATHAGGGSIAFTGASRSVMAVGKSPRNPEQHVLASTKINLALAPESLAYTLESTTVAGTSAPAVRWVGIVDVSADQLMRDSITPSSVRVEVQSELMDLLAVEPLDIVSITKRLHADGVECSKDLLYDVLRLIADKVILNNGTTARKVIYRLKDDYQPPEAPTGPGRDGPDPIPQPDPQDRETGPDRNLEMDSGETVNPQPDPQDTAGPESITETETGEPGESVNPQPPDSKNGSDPMAQTSGSGSGLTDPPEPPAPTPFVNADEILACAICGQVDGIVYFEQLRTWRCPNHFPDLGDV